MKSYPQLYPISFSRPLVCRCFGTARRKTKSSHVRHINLVQPQRQSFHFHAYFFLNKIQDPWDNNISTTQDRRSDLGSCISILNRISKFSGIGWSIGSGSDQSINDNPRFSIFADFILLRFCWLVSWELFDLIDNKISHLLNRYQFGNWVGNHILVQFLLDEPLSSWTQIIRAPPETSTLIFDIFCEVAKKITILLLVLRLEIAS